MSDLKRTMSEPLCRMNQTISHKSNNDTAGKHPRSRRPGSSVAAPSMSRVRFILNLFMVFAFTSYMFTFVLIQGKQISPFFGISERTNDDGTIAAIGGVHVLAREDVSTSTKEVSPNKLVLRAPKNSSSTISFTTSGGEEPQNTLPRTTTTTITTTTTTTITTTTSPTPSKVKMLEVPLIMENLEVPHVADDLCHGCRHVFVDKKQSGYCGLRIQQAMNNKTSLAEAAKMIARNYSEACFRCDPDACSKAEKRYLQWDHAAPALVDNGVKVTNWLPSVPSSHRLDPNAMNDLDAYLSNRNNTYPQKWHLFDYNPSIVQLPDQYQFSMDGKRAVYLASYRVTHINMCFDWNTRLSMYGGSKESMEKVPETDYLGLAFVSQDFEILKDAVVSFKRKHNPKVKAARLLPDLEKFRNPQLMDYRLFNIKNRVYLSIGITVTPLAFVMNTTTTGADNRVTRTVLGVANRTLEEYTPLREVFPGQFKVYIRRYASCGVYGGSLYEKSKNLQYFVDSNGNTMMEHKPGQNPHDVRYVDLEERCGKQNKTKFNTSQDFMEPLPSFGTTEELLYPYLTKRQILFPSDRGSACCVQVDNPYENNKTYLVGISHPKVHYPGRNLPKGMYSNSYLSRLYAFEDTPPYKVVARTGKFCFGYTAQEDHSDHPLWNLTKWDVTNNPMVLGNNTLNCPKIHFASGITTKYGDASKVIVAYGINDCTSRFVEVDKGEIARMLWNPWPR